MAEALFTCVLAFTVLSVGLNPMTESTAGALSIACSLMCLTFAFGSVSGTHFNLAVTVAVVASGRSKCLTQRACGTTRAVAGRLRCLAKGSAIAGESFESLKPASSEWYQVV